MTPSDEAAVATLRATIGQKVQPIDVQIAQAYAELLLARADAERSPNADSMRTELNAEGRLNRLLERRHAAHAVV